MTFPNDPDQSQRRQLSNRVSNKGWVFGGIINHRRDPRGLRVHVGWKQQLRVEHLHRAGEHDGCQRWLTGHGIPTRVARKTLTVVPRWA